LGDPSWKPHENYLTPYQVQKLREDPDFIPPRIRSLIKRCHPNSDAVRQENKTFLEREVALNKHISNIENRIKRYKQLHPNYGLFSVNLRAHVGDWRAPNIMTDQDKIFATLKASSDVPKYLQDQIRSDVYDLMVLEATDDTPSLFQHERHFFPIFK